MDLLRVSEDLLWNSSFTLPKNSSSGSDAVDVRVLVDRSLVEVFVAGGKVAALMAYQPPGLDYTQVHLLGADEQSPGQAHARAVRVESMGCGWVGG